MDVSIPSVTPALNYNLNVTEFLYPAFSLNFQFHRRDPSSDSVLSTQPLKQTFLNFISSVLFCCVNAS